MPLQKAVVFQQFLSTPSARRATPELWPCSHLLTLFLSTPSARRATVQGSKGPFPLPDFYPRPPRGGRRRRRKRRRKYPAISIHALREEGDALARVNVHAVAQFLSTPSARRATPHVASTPSSARLFLSTPSARRATGCRFPSPAGRCYFYPRPPRGGRRASAPAPHPAHRISIHALREEGDKSMVIVDGSRSLFLSTPSARRATRQRPGTPPSTPDFYPRPPRGGRQVDGDRGRQQVVISIHALREEGDIRRTCDTAGWRLFLSTPSARRATKSGFRRGQCRQISIHALREEGDLTARSYPPMVCYFYPRPPRGGRHMDDVVILADSKISIHALREEGDLQVHHLFNLGKAISIHALREEGDYGFCNIVTHFLYFYPRPPRGGRPSSRGDGMRGRSFLSTPSARRATKIKKEVS